MRARPDGRYGPKTITSSLSSGAVVSAVLIVGYLPMYIRRSN